MSVVNNKISDSTDSNEQITQLVSSFLKEGNTFKHLKNISEDTMNAIYSVAYNLYTNAKYSEAQNIFQFLCLFDHFEKKYWMGLAASRQMLKQYEPAITAYGLAAVLDLEDPKPSLHAADCYLSMGNYHAAEQALTASMHWSKDKPEYASLHERAEGVLNLLRKTHHEEPKNHK